MLKFLGKRGCDTQACHFRAGLLRLSLFSLFSAPFSPLLPSEGGRRFGAWAARPPLRSGLRWRRHYRVQVSIKLTVRLQGRLDGWLQLAHLDVAAIEPSVQKDGWRTLHACVEALTHFRLHGVLVFVGG